jgi:hypothetical protein
VVIIGFALLFAVTGSIFGWRYPGKNNQYAQRLVWAFADLAWILLTLFAVGKLIGAVTQILPIGEFSYDPHLSAQRHLITRIYIAEDELCERPVASETDCRLLQNIRRHITLPMFSSLDAFLISRKVGEICPAKTCAPPMMAVKNAVLKLRASYADLSDLPTDEQDGNWLGNQWVREITIGHSNLFFLIVLFGARMGRTAAEFRRIFDDRPREPKPRDLTSCLS